MSFSDITTHNYHIYHHYTFHQSLVQFFYPFWIDQVNAVICCRVGGDPAITIIFGLCWWDCRCRFTQHNWHLSWLFNRIKTTPWPHRPIAQSIRQVVFFNYILHHHRAGNLYYALFLHWHNTFSLPSPHNTWKWLQSSPISTTKDQIVMGTDTIWGYHSIYPSKSTNIITSCNIDILPWKCQLVD